MEKVGRLIIRVILYSGQYDMRLFLISPQICGQKFSDGKFILILMSRYKKLTG